MNGYYSAIKKDETLPFTSMGMELEGIMLSKISQSEKYNYHMVSLMWNVRNSTEDHGGREGKWNGKTSEKETNHERLSTIGNKRLLEGGGWQDGVTQ